ncbi:cache domain-containing sensor histidine kinase [Paenibacillus riograndensis]|uniref:Putative membrane protein n=1 Tax=Paenibacillus riograndensis SBR5 TaxID=1073571 RepID=A0A0E4HEH4_9BACL|nr:histidine kinase [Paenibacillus riograndensis]CQR57722.1 putative membrane protein [Paenibacillus riograndensis SBR5]
MRIRKWKGSSRLLSRLSLPIFVLIVTFIALFATAASYILIRVQNDHTLKLAEQSMKFVYMNAGYQFDTMNNVAAFIATNQSIENLLESTYQEPFDAVDDFYILQANLQNLSLLSLLNDFRSQEAVQQSYIVSVALEPGSGLYEMATNHFYPVTGIFKSDDLKNQPWFRSLSSKERQTEWWGERTDRPEGAMIYSARRKTSLKDGRSIGTVIVGASIRSIQSVFRNAELEQGYHLLLDEGNRVIFSERYSFLESADELPVVRALDASKESMIANIDGEKQRVMSETFENGWRLLTIVPESHISRYTLVISAIGAASVAAALLIAGFWLRRIVVRVTVPITRLVTTIQRLEVSGFKDTLPQQKSGIYEVDELSQTFGSMLVTLHGLIEKSFEEELERRELQLELLHAQINPHFIYNTLDLINCRAIMAGDMESSKIVRSLANVFRFSLNRGQTLISLEEEIKQVEAYLHIQKMMMDHLQVIIQVPVGLLQARMVHLTLQPLAENAIVHGFTDRQSDCRITITARLEGRLLLLRVEDNGTGCDVERMNEALQEKPASEPGIKLLEPGNGYGMMNVHRRIQLHCGKAYGLRYLPAAKGTCVEAVLPFYSDSILPEMEAVPYV